MRDQLSGLRDTGRRWRLARVLDVHRGACLAIIAGLTAIVASRFDFIPIWDGAWYFERLEHAVRGPFGIEAYTGGHLSTTFYLIYGLIQQLSPGSVHLLNGTGLAFGILSIVAFAVLLRRQFPAPELRPELALVTGIFAVFPVFLADLFTLSPDYPAMVFVVVFLAALCSRRPRLAFVFGLAATFCKESGAALVCAVAVIYTIVFHLRGARAGKVGRRQILAGARLFLPTMCYGLYLSVFVLNGASTHPTAWPTLVREMPISVSRLILDFDLSERMLRAYLTDVFVMNFNWLLTLPILGLLGCLLVLWVVGRSPLTTVPFQEFALFNGLTLAAAVYITTRYRHFNNPRYLLICFPPLMLVAYGSLLSLVKVRWLRLVYLAAAAALIGASTVQTIDPVSKRISGTFAFGAHDLLVLDSTKPVLMLRDELVYNLEYQYVHYLFDDLLAAVKPDENTWILSGLATCFYLPGRVDRLTFHRTLRLEDTIDVNMRCHDVAILPELLKKNARVFYADFPNTRDPQYLAVVLRKFRQVEHATLSRDGYSIDLFRLEPP
jgi:hypothetical protein